MFKIFCYRIRTAKKYKKRLQCLKHNDYIDDFKLKVKYFTRGDGAFIDVYVKPTKIAEHIIFNFVIHGKATYEN